MYLKAGIPFGVPVFFDIFVTVITKMKTRKFIPKNSPLN